MAELIYRFVKQQNQGRQDSYNRYDADNNALKKQSSENKLDLFRLNRIFYLAVDYPKSILSYRQYFLFVLLRL